MALGRGQAGGLMLAVVLLLPPGAEATQRSLISGPVVFVSAGNDVSPPLAFLGPPKPPVGSDVGVTGGGSLYGPVESLEGIAKEENEDSSANVPPDANGAVGPLDYVQAVNDSVAVYDKRGTRRLGPMPSNRIWAGFGGFCETTNRGDAIVRYDQLASRWVITQYAFVSISGVPKPPYYQCFAVSTTPDPTGPYYRYRFEIPDAQLNDYPKLAVWPDAYYMSANRYESGPAGVGAFAFERAAMLAGRPARAISFQLVDRFLGMLPSDLDGQRLPPPGATEAFVKADDDACGYPHDQLELWRFRADFADPAASRFTGPTLLRTQPFDSGCDEREIVQQPETTQLLEILSDRLMFRASYRNLGSSQSLLAMHTVLDAEQHAGIRWYEIRFPAGTAQIHQQGTYQPDGDSRWMGSIAGDRAGDVAIGFSVSGTTTFPSIGYVGHAATEAPGAMESGEGRLVTGAGSQTTSNRWGDYSSLTVDPVDDCTFWYTQEYYPAASTVGWHTRIGSFRFPNCGAAPAISGVEREGATLRASNGSWPELPGATFGYQWRRCDARGGSCSDIPGATDQTYLPRTLDVDNTLRVVVTASTPAAIASALSAETPLIVPVPAPGPLALVTTMAAAPSVLKPGGRVVYTIRVGNAGTTGSATGVVLSVSAPEGAQLLSTAVDRGPGCAGAQPIVCPLDFLPGGRTATVTIVARVKMRGALRASASITADQPFSDPGAAQTSTTITVRAAPKLVLLTPRLLRARRTSAAVLVSASLSIDEPAALTARALDPRTGRSLRLLPGTTLGDAVLRGRSDRISNDVDRGDVGILLRIPPASVRRGSIYRLIVKANDRDGLSASLSVAFRS